MFLARAFVLAVLLATFGCARYATSEDPAAQFPYRHSDFDYKVAWKAVASEKGTTIEGILKNVRYPFIDDLDVSVDLVDKDNHVRSHGTAVPIPQQSREDEIISFQVNLPGRSPVQGDLLRFIIHYKASEGGQDSGVDWRSSFVVDAISGTAVPSDGGASHKW